jgi:hypothetical protein
MKSEVVIAIIGFIASIALANAPSIPLEAPPTTETWFGYTFGAQYEYSDMEVDVHNHEYDFDIRAVYGTFTVPLSSRLDFFLRLGGARASTTDFDGGTDWAWGMGARGTIATWDELALEAKGQITSVTSSKARTLTVYDSNHPYDHDDPNYFRGDDQLSLFEYNLKVGPTWSHGPLSLSGGAMARYMTGDFTYYGDNTTEKVDHQTCFGGYLGIGFDITEAISFFGDVQADRRLTRFSAGVLWRL